MALMGSFDVKIGDFLSGCSLFEGISGDGINIHNLGYKDYVGWGCSGQ